MTVIVGRGGFVEVFPCAIVELLTRAPGVKRWTRTKASRHSDSECSLKGSRFSLPLSVSVKSRYCIHKTQTLAFLRRELSLEV